jgi:hypothetical protein
MNFIDYINVQIVCNIVIYFCIGLLAACSYLYFAIPSLNSEDYRVLFPIIFLWPVSIPLYVILYIRIYLFEKIDEFKNKSN